MRHDPLSDPDLSPYRIDYRKFAEKEGCFTSLKQLKKHFFCGKNYELEDHMIRSYYHYNILNYYTPLSDAKRVLEIGAGNGNFASIFKYCHPKMTYFIVDLAETLCASTVFLQDVFPNVKTLLPNEIEGKKFDDYDFVFLTPGQIDVLEDQSFDLVSNLSSFQEMTKKQIADYFELAHRILKKGSGHLYACNRVEKIPTGDDPYNKACHEDIIRFSEFPWFENVETKVYEICKFSRLTQIDNMFMRLDKIV